MLKELDREMAVDESKIYLVDEADHAMEKDMVKWNTRALSEYTGFALFALCRRSYHFTATLDRLCVDVAKNLFIAQSLANMVHRFEPKIKITHGLEGMVIDYKLERDWDDLKSRTLEVASEYLQDGFPVIIFIDHEELFAELAEGLREPLSDINSHIVTLGPGSDKDFQMYRSSATG